MTKAIFFLIVSALGYSQATFRALNGVSTGFSCGGTYAHCASIVVSSAKVGSGGVSAFPVLISGTVTQLKTVANGGQVLNTVAQTGGSGLTVPADFIVASDVCVTKSPFEFETYVATSGAFRLHANAAALSSSTGGTIYACWGASGVTTWQGDVPGTWNPAFAGVWHFPDGTTLSTVDSTGNRTTSGNSGTVTAGQIDGAIAYNGSQTTVLSSSLPQTTPFTLSAWINIVGGSFGAILGSTGGSGNIEWRVDSGNTMTVNSAGVAGVGTSNTALTPSTWEHVAVTYDGSTIRFYLNGVADGSASSSQTFSGTANAFGIWSSDVYNGKLDEFKFSNVIRSAAWILTEFNNQSSPSTFYAFTVLA